MSLDFLSHLILEYRYWILVPLSFLEGPLIAFIAGALASLGYFNLYVLAILFFVRDVGMDGVYYLIGWHARKRETIKRFLQWIGIDEDELKRIRALWVRRPMITMFLSKVSYGIASTFIMLAGLIEMPLNLFFGYGSIVAVLQYGGLLLLGYEFGAAFGTVSKLFTHLQYALAALALLGSAYYLLMRYVRRKLRRAEEGSLPE